MTVEDDLGISTEDFCKILKNARNVLPSEPYKLSPLWLVIREMGRSIARQGQVKSHSTEQVSIAALLTGLVIGKRIGNQPIMLNLEVKKRRTGVI